MGSIGPRRDTVLRRTLVIAVALAALASITGAEAGVRVIEKHANLDIATRVAARLRAAGIQVWMTRTDDRTLRTDQRVGPANRRRVDAFVSIHNNASRTSSLSGSEIYRSVRRDGSQRLGHAIWRAFAAEFGSARRNVLRTRRGCCGDYYYQLRRTRMASVLVEGAYVTNPREGRLLGSRPAFRRRIAAAIAEGVLRWQRSLAGGSPPDLDPGTTAPAPLPPPVDLHAEARGANRIALRWLMSPGVEYYRVYRDEQLVAVRRGVDGDPVDGIDAEHWFVDRWAGPATTYRYRVAPVTRLDDGIWGEGLPASVEATTPPISVMIDAGHGGRDPGAVARYP